MAVDNRQAGNGRSHVSGVNSGADDVDTSGTAYHVIRELCNAHSLVICRTYDRHTP